MKRGVLAATVVVAAFTVSGCVPDINANPESSSAIQQVIERAIDRRNQQLMAGVESSVDEISQDFVQDSVAGIAQDYELLHQRRERLASHAFGYTGIRSGITMKELTVSRDRAEALVSEKTQISYPPVGGVQGPEEGYVYEQKVTLEKVGTQWKIITQGPASPEGLLPSTVIDHRSG
ncbi:hypothetical protein [Paenarthrobacter nicotinovorans]|jgi:hypothetical protein|uniref:hypothetical protein n=1 Tax=Paenarthrobacter nicotinovorans TaxID=29320 RepID=UPI000B258E80